LRISKTDAQRAHHFNSLGVVAQYRYQSSHDIADLNLAVENMTKSVDLTPDTDSDRALRMNNLARVLVERYQEIRSTEDLAAAIKIVEGYPSHRDHAECLHILGCAYQLRFSSYGLRGDLQRALDAKAGSVSAGANDPQLSGYLSSLGDTLEVVFDETGSAEALNQAVYMNSKALDLTEKDARSRPNKLNNYATALQKKYEISHEVENLNISIDSLQEAIQLSLPKDPNIAMFRSNLSQALQLRFQVDGRTEDIDLAIHESQVACHSISTLKPMYLNNLGNALELRGQRNKSVVDLTEAIRVKKVAVEETQAGDPQLAAHLTNLGSALKKRFRYSRKFEDLTESVRFHTKAIDLTSESHPNKPKYLSNLGSTLVEIFNEDRSLHNLNTAVEIFEKSLQLTQDIHPVYVLNLANALELRYKWAHSISDLDRSIEILQDTTSNDDKFLYCLGTKLLTRYEYTGSHDDLAHAIRVLETSAQNCQNPTAKPYRLSAFANALEARFNLTGSVEDINSAVSLKLELLKSTSDPDYAGFLDSYGSTLHTRFCGQGSIVDLNEAVRVCGESLGRTLIPIDRPRYLNNYASVLHERFLYSGNIIDLNKAIDASREAVGSDSVTNYDGAIYLATLGICLQSRAEHLNSEDLTNAVTTFRRALALAPPARRPVLLANLGRVLHQQFRRTGIGLEESMEALTECLSLISEEHPAWTIYASIRTTVLHTHFQQTESVESLDLSMESAVKVVNKTHNKHPARPGRLNTLGCTLQLRFGQCGLMEDLERSIAAHESAIELITDSHPLKAIYLNNFASALHLSFGRTNSRDTLEKAINITETALKLMAETHFERVHCLTNLSSLLGWRFTLTGSIIDLNKAVDHSTSALRQCPQGHIHRPACLNNLGITLHHRFGQTGSLEDLENAIRFKTDASNSVRTAKGRQNFLASVGVSLTRRFEFTGNFSDLTRALEIAKEVVELTPSNDPQRRIYLYELADALRITYERKGRLDDLDDSIDAIQQAIVLERRSEYLDSLGLNLRLRFERTGSLKDLDAAVENAEAAIESIPRDHIFRFTYANNLATALLHRYKRTGKPEVLKEAEEMVQEAVKKMPGTHPNSALYFDTLCSILQERSNSVNDLNQAVKAGLQAVRCTLNTHRNKISYLTNLGNALQKRFESTGALEDINRAVQYKQQSIDCIPADHRFRAKLLNNLGNTLRARAARTGSVIDYRKAVETTTAAVECTSQDSPDRPMFLNNQGNAQYETAEAERSSADLTKAIDSYDKAIQCHHSGSHRSSYLNNLGSASLLRFKWERSMTDLKRAASVLGEAVRSVEENHPNRATYYYNYGDALYQLGSEEEAALAFSESFHSELSPLIVRLEAAERGAKILSTRNVPLASRLLTEAIELLPNISPRTLQRNDQQYALSQFDRLASDAAALAMKAGESAFKAISLLELGRGVMASTILDTRSDITDLADTHLDIANTFKRLRDELDSVINSQEDPDESALIRRHAAAKEFSDIIHKIRGLEGYSNFLKAPSQEKLQSLAAPGPIVIVNISRYGSYTFVVTSGAITHKKLPLRYADVEAKAEELIQILYDDSFRSRRSLRKILEWLWDGIVKGTLDDLGYRESVEDHWPLIWWIPVGRMALFPFHAAGYHTKASENALDRIISSYTHTIKALDYARTQIARMSFPKPSVLLVSMSTTPDRKPLKYAKPEIDGVAKILGSVVKETLDYPTKRDILQKIRQYQVVHFACHGSYDKNPSNSVIYFSDWKSDPFSVSDMVNLKLNRGRLAYLSACHSSRNRDLSLLDEGIHMAGACQLAGFPSVIGTFWQISDEYSPFIAQEVYGRMLTSDGNLDFGKAALGLHLAVRKLREQTRLSGKNSYDDPIAWAPYRYIGG
jgi:tetratricopeptide (TPR) repeat protein